MFTGTIGLLVAVGSILLAENIKYSINDSKYTSTTFINKETYNLHLQSQENSSFNLDDVEQRCPKGLIYYQHRLGIPFCYVLTDEHPYLPTCPYENILEDNTITSIYDIFKYRSIWANAIRNRNDEFGPFQWLDTSNRYLDVISNYKTLTGSIADKNCLIRYNHSLIPVSCKEHHPRLCIYSYFYRGISKHCTKRTSFTNCISATLNLDNKCFCQAIIKENGTLRNNFCKKLAEPADYFQNHLLLTELYYKTPCWFGAEQGKNQIFHWSSSNQELPYFYWKETTDFLKPFGVLDYTSPRGWLLMEDGILNCGICEIEAAPQNVSIFLKQYPKSDKIEIRINNVFDIHNYFIFQYILVCFTDSSNKTLKTRIVSGISPVAIKNNPVYKKVITIDNYFPSYYWCETVQRPHLTRVFSNKILAYKDMGKHNHEYALIIDTFVPQETDPYLKDLHISTTEFIQKKLNDSGIVNIVRPLKIITISEIDQKMTLLIHISTTESYISAKAEYTILLNHLETLIIEYSNLILKIINFSRAEVCLESTTQSGNLTLHWPETNIGSTIIPEELCLMENSMPVTRTCEGDFLHGGKWSAVDGDCFKQEFTNRTIQLYRLLHVEEDPNKITGDLCNITQNHTNMLLVDVHYTAEILSKIKNSKGLNTTQVIQIFNQVMVFNKDLMKQAQQTLNSTDVSLDALDKILSNIEILTTSDYISIQSKYLLIQISDLRRSNITGVAFSRTNRSSPNCDAFEIYELNPLYNGSMPELFHNRSEIAVYLSNANIKEIRQCPSVNKTASLKLIISLFYNNKLFNDAKDCNKTSNSMVVNVLIPGFLCHLKTPFSVFFKPFNKSKDINCGYWKYGMNDLNENIFGHWKDDGILNNKLNNKLCFICEFYHTTHYALLVWKDNVKSSVSEETNLILDILTLIGCILSLLGLFCVFITAIIFKNWRNRSRNIIMLNFSAALTAQILLLFIADHAAENKIICFISGAGLHYTLLSEFAWMLIIAILQYRKFVVVFYKPIPFLILKCVIIGWIIPLMPIIIYLIFFPESYNNSSNGICYLQYAYFNFGVVLPLSIIILINLTVFIIILVNICRKKVDAYGPQTNEVRLQVLLATSLFFLLGLSWAFGICAALTNSMVFSYIFCITATLQGFVIFLFFIVMNENSRVLWINTKKIFCRFKISERFY